MLQVAGKKNDNTKSAFEHAQNFRIENLSADFDQMIQNILAQEERLHIAVDCRLINATGIGMCLKGWLPYMISRYSNWHYTLFGDVAELAAFSWVGATNIRIKPFTAPIYSLREQWEWLRLNPNKFDLLWIPHLNIPLFWHGKMLVTVHDVIFPAMPKIFSLKKRTATAMYFHRIKHCAVHVMFVSRFTLHEFHEFIGRPVGDETVVYNTVDKKWFEVRRDFPLPETIASKPYIVCVGNVKPHKNLRRLIEAFKLIMDHVPHNLIIIGKKHGFLTGDSGINALAESACERIIFTGYIADEELRNLVAQASLLVQPSLYEGFGITPLEAMAVCCPIALSRIPAFEEICGDHATYFNPLDIENMAIVIRDCLIPEKEILME